MGKYLPPSGYSLPKQAYSRFGYGDLWLPAKLGIMAAVMPSFLSAPPIPPARPSFAALFPTAYQAVQTDVDLFAYGTVMKVTAGNTSTSAPVLSGTINGVAVPIWVKSTNTLAVGSGATFNIYYDGTGTTPAMSGVTPTAGVPVALTGLGSGMFITWSAGTSVTNDSWKSTCAGFGGISGYVQLTPGLQPIVTIGLNGCPGLLFDGTDDFMSSVCNIPAPGTTPWCGYAVIRRPTTAAGNARLLDNAGDSSAIIANGATTMVLFNNGTFGPIGTGLPTNTWGAIDFKFSNSAADYIRIGSGPTVSGAGAGNNPNVNPTISQGAAPANEEILAVGYVPSTSFNAASFRTQVTAIYGASVNV